MQRERQGRCTCPMQEEKGRTLTQDALFMLTMVLILIFAAFARPAAGESGIWSIIFAAKWYITGALLIVLAFMLKGWFRKRKGVTWVQATWGFMKQIFPLLAGGVLVAGFMLGRPGHEALIPEHYIQTLVGGNSLWANLFAAVAGALMYFATLTEVPILQGLIGCGNGPGSCPCPASGRSCPVPAEHARSSAASWEPRRPSLFCATIVILSTIAGMLYGSFAG